MTGSKTCSKCNGRMEQGYIPEAREYTAKVSSWIEGEPRKAWFGLKLRGLRQFEIETWRCSRCGFLEEYAPGN